jgi:hypothetical protein
MKSNSIRCIAGIPLWRPVLMGLVLGGIFIAAVKPACRVNIVEVRTNTARAAVGAVNALLIGKIVTSASLNELAAKGVLRPDQLMDPWGRAYRIEIPARRAVVCGRKFDLYSQGTNTDTEADDVGNWNLD